MDVLNDYLAFGGFTSDSKLTGLTAA
jgi:hypothetical protein